MKKTYHKIKSKKLKKFGILGYSKLEDRFGNINILYRFTPKKDFLRYRVFNKGYSVKSEKEIKILNRFVEYYLLSVLECPNQHRNLLNNLLIH